MPGKPRKTTEEFIKQAREINGDRFDYSETVYTVAKNKIIVKCRKHKTKQAILPFSHLLGQGCNKCAAESSRAKQLFSTDTFIKRSREVHGDKYDYSLVDYKGAKQHVTIICNELDENDVKHGEFSQAADGHINGYGCKKCQAQKQRYTLPKFIEKAKKVHGDKYKYLGLSRVKVSGHDRLIIDYECPKHGGFSQRVDGHLIGVGCPACSESIGEKMVYKILTSLNIKFKSQKNSMI